MITRRTLLAGTGAALAGAGVLLSRGSGAARQKWELRRAPKL
jgi:hypothetical protein